MCSLDKRHKYIRPSYHGRRENPTVPETSIPVHMKAPTIPYGRRVVKDTADDDDVVALEAAAPVVKLGLDVAVAGREEKLGSAVYVADRSVTLVQTFTEDCTPEIKFTAAHCIKLDTFFKRIVLARKHGRRSYLVENAVGSVLDYANNSFLSCP
jgi:hypothetical protein